MNWQLKVMALTAVTITLFSLTFVRLAYYAINKKEIERNEENADARQKDG